MAPRQSWQSGPPGSPSPARRAGNGQGFLLPPITRLILIGDLTQTWVWWASGIVLGVAIRALVAVFEKRRNDVLLLIDEIKKGD